MALASFENHLHGVTNTILAWCGYVTKSLTDSIPSNPNKCLYVNDSYMYVNLIGVHEMHSKKCIPN